MTEHELRGEVGALLPAIEHDAALAEARAGADGDPERFAAAVEAVRAGCSHPAMARWVERIELLQAPPPPFAT